MKKFPLGLAFLLASLNSFAGLEKPIEVRMVKGERVFLRVEGIETFALSNPSVVSVSVKGESLQIEAKSSGVCCINAHSKEGGLKYLVIVDENSFLSRLAEKAQKALSSPHIVVYGKEEGLVLEGRASSPEEAERAKEVASSFWPKVEDRVMVHSLASNPSVKLGGNPSLPSGEAPQPATEPLPPPEEEVGRKISLLVGMGKVLTTKGPLKRVAVADPSICECVVLGAYEVFLTAKKPGVTSLYLWEEPLIAGGEVRLREYEVEVKEKKENLREELEKALKEAGLEKVKVRFVEGRDRVVLLGMVPTEEERRMAEGIATAFAEKVINMVEVEEPPPPPPPKVPVEEEKVRRIREAIGLPGVEVKVIGDTVVLTGEVETEEQKRRAEEMAGLFGLKVMSQLTVKEPKREKQVQVEARVLELDWRWLRNVGLEWGTTDLFGFTRWFEYFRPPAVVPGVPPFPFFPGIGVPGVGVGIPGMMMGLTPGALSFGELWAEAPFVRLSPIFVLIRFLEEKHIGRVLSAPNLTLKDGQTGEIHVGGEIPLPAPAVGPMAAIAVGVTFKTYGIILEVTPRIKEPDLIELTVRAEVSEPDWEVAITIMGTTVPGTRVREARTMLQVRDGETIVIGGLIGEEDIETVRKVPFLGDLPVIGGLFRRKEERKSQTVLVFFLTAHILE